MPKPLKPAPVLQCDWLQIHVNYPTGELHHFHPHFKAKLLPLGTRHFRSVEELYFENKRVATVVSKPHSPLLDEKMVLVKFDNWVLYGKDISAYVDKFMLMNKMNFQNISRIDICTDFQAFENKMLPQNFINKFIRSTCIKFGKCSKFRAVGTQKESVHEFESLRFGSNLSEVSYYLYNKKKEMNEVKWKPWIEAKWKQAGFDLNKDTWRLEFSLKSGSKQLVNTDTGETKLLTSLEILKPEIMKLSFNILRQQYFRFVWNDGQKRKSRMRELKLFNGDFSNYTVIDCTGKHDANRSTKIFIKKLEEVNNELRGENWDMCIAANALKQKMIESRGLESWAMRNQLAN